MSTEYYLACHSCLIYVHVGRLSASMPTWRLNTSEHAIRALEAFLDTCQGHAIQFDEENWIADLPSGFAELAVDPEDRCPECDLVKWHVQADDARVKWHLKLSELRDAP